MFTQRALRIQFQIHITRKNHLLQEFVLAHVAANVFADMFLKEQPEPEILDSCVVGNGRETPRAFRHTVLIRFSGMAQSPNPPVISTALSPMSETAWSALSTTLFT